MDKDSDIKKKPSKIWKAVKSCLKYTAIGAAIIGVGFALTKPPVLLAVLRLGLPLVAVGTLGYGAVSLTRSIFRPRKKTVKKSENTDYTISNVSNNNNFSRRIIRRRKKGVGFNSKASPVSADLKEQNDNKPDSDIKNEENKPTEENKTEGTLKNNTVKKKF